MAAMGSMSAMTAQFAVLGMRMTTGGLLLLLLLLRHHHLILLLHRHEMTLHLLIRERPLVAVTRLLRLVIGRLLPTTRRPWHIHRHGRAARTVVVNGGPIITGVRCRLMLRITGRVVAHGPDAESAVAGRGRR